MEDQVPVRAPSWSPLEAVPVAAIALAIPAVFAATMRETPTSLVLVALAFELALGGVAVAWVALVRRANVQDLGLGSARAGRDLAFGFGSGLLLFAGTVLALAPALYALVSLITGEPVEPPQQPVLPEDPETIHIVLGGVAVVVAAPIGEEIFFRGFLFGALRARTRFWVAAPLSAVAFAIFHVIPLLMPLMFVVGLGLAYLYERRGSLLSPIAAHAAFNLIGYVAIVGAMR